MVPGAILKDLTGTFKKISLVTVRMAPDAEMIDFSRWKLQIRHPPNLSPGGESSWQKTGI